LINEIGGEMIAIIFIVLLICPINPGVFAGSNTSEITIEPRLAYPLEPEVTVTGEYLEFKWWPAATGVRTYEFSLYKGGGLSGDVILEKHLPFNVTSLKVDAKLLEDNQIYTWTLRQVADNGQKSDKSFSTFKVIKP
jgi:hypothetical protein